MKVRMSAEQKNREAFLSTVISKYHFQESDRELLETVYESVRVAMSPYAMYRLNQRMRGLRDIDDNQAAVVAMTLGDGVDRVKAQYMKKNELAEAYMLDCIANELLLSLYAEFNRAYPKFHRRYIKRYVFLGSELPLTDVEQLLDEIRGVRKEKEPASDGDAREEKKRETGEKPQTALEAAGSFREETAAELVDRGALIRRETARSQEIHANEYGALTPSKSVVFFAVLSDDPSQLCEGICEACNNSNCVNRGQAQRQKETVFVSEQNYNYGYQRIFGETLSGEEHGRTEE